MKGLLLKDLFVLSKQMRVFFVMIFFFAVIPAMNMTVFAVVYAAMMPYSALAYDERSHWEQLAAAMPYSVRDIVVSKYVLGWLFTGLASLLALVADFVVSLFSSTAVFSPLSTLLSFCVGVLTMALTLPAMFRFGVEKGRMLFVFVMVFVACGSAGLVMGLVGSGFDALLSSLQLILPAVTVVVSLLSIQLSIKFYAKREA